MTITIDILSLFIGMILGFVIMFGFTFFMYFDDRWDSAFAEGWQCGSNYQKSLSTKEHKEDIK